MLKSLPSAKYRALGKGHLCRVPHSAKLGTRQIGLCRVSGTRQNKTLGKAKLCPVPDTRQSWALGKEAPGITVPNADLFAECLLFGTRQNIGFAECLGLALGKIFTLPSAKPWHSAKYFFLFFATNFFWSFSTLPQTTCLNLGYFHCLLAYFYSLFCFVEFFGKM